MATASILFRLVLCAEERPGDAWPATVAGLALPAGLPLRAAIRPRAKVDDDRHVRVVLVVLDHLLEELVLELAGDHAIDHPLIVGLLEPCDFRDRAAFGPRTQNRVRDGRCRERPCRPGRPARSTS